MPMHTTYGATKAAMDQITRVMAAELGPKQVLTYNNYIPTYNYIPAIITCNYVFVSVNVFHFCLLQIRTNNVNPTVTLTPMGKEFWGSDPVKANKMKSRIPLGKFAGKVLVNKHIHKKM